ncbi:hypothetical protein BJX76DRAFT_351197 [Aspergillus varians]
MRHHCDYSHDDHHRIIKQQQRKKVWKMADNRSRRQPYSVPYTTAAMDASLLLPDDSMLYTSQAPFASMPAHLIHIPDEYLPYGSQLNPAASYYPAQPYLTHQAPYYTNTPTTNPAQPNQQWLHPQPQQSPLPPSSSHSSSRHHHHQNHYQDSIPSSDLDPDFDPDFDLDLDNPPFTQSPSPTPSATGTGTTTLPSRTPSTSSSNTKDLTLYGTPSPTHPGAWRCAYPNCTSPSLFRRGCDLRKHYNRHRKHLFCRHDGCPQANAQIPGAGFSSKKDRDRHEAKHNPGIVCEWAGEGCTRVFSRVDNMKDHVRRIHLRVGN